MTTYGIYPAIGIARVGNSEEHYIAPESWQTDFVPDSGYRDADGKIKRMGCRFRIYEFDSTGAPLREITSADAEIRWSVRLANKKAAKSDPFAPIKSKKPLNRETSTNRADMIIDSGDQQITGADQDVELGGMIGPPSNRIDVKLGNLITDPEGRLIVLGGHGSAGSWKHSPLPPDGYHNPDWFDDTSDGPVRAQIRLNRSQDWFEAESAWVLVGPPDYAHPVVNVVTLYDTVYNASVPAPPAPPPPSFTQDIYPVLHRVAHMQWTLMSTAALQFGRTAMHGHGIRGNHPSLNDLLTDMHQGVGDFLSDTVFPQLYDSTGQWLRAHVFERLKPPSTGGGNGPGQKGLPQSMPPVELFTLTPAQYEHFRRWSIDDFIDDWDVTWDPVDPPPLPAFDTIAVDEQPTTLNRAALDGGVGGPLAPGIEAGPKMGEARTYQGPFRIDPDEISAGDLTEDLSVPWHAAFNLGVNRWPGARPVLVIVQRDANYTTEFWTRPYTSIVPIVPVDKADSVNIYENYKSIYENQQMAHNLNMIDHWSGLGFLARDFSVTDEPVYIEKERTLPD